MAGGLRSSHDGPTVGEVVTAGELREEYEAAELELERALAAGDVGTAQMANLRARRAFNTLAPMLGLAMVRS